MYIKTCAFQETDFFYQHLDKNYYQNFYQHILYLQFKLVFFCSFSIDTRTISSDGCCQQSYPSEQNQQNDD